MKKGKTTEKPADWSDKEHIRVLIEGRKFMWNEDYVVLLAKLIGLVPGKTIADIGCGLGYLGHIYGRFIRPSGKYFGVDQNHKIVQMACRAAADYRLGKLLRFVEGSALTVPLKDESVDVAMCQTLLMHLKKPESAIREMKRITKKHGKVVAFEPDWDWPSSRWRNYPRLPVKERLEDLDAQYHMLEGRKRLGFGDFKIGPRVPYLFLRCGLKNIEVRKSDKVTFALIPPYGTPELEQARKVHLETLKRLKKKTKGEKRKEYLEAKKFYVSGGGDAEMFKRLKRHGSAWYKRHLDRRMQMLRHRKLYEVGDVPFYVVIGEK